MRFLQKRKLDASSLSKMRKAKGLSKRDVAVLKRHAVELIDSTTNHRDYRLLAFHRRRKRTRWINSKTGNTLEFRSDKSVYIRVDFEFEWAA